MRHSALNSLSLSGLVTLLVFTCWLPASAEGISEVHLIEWQKTTYQVVEVKEKFREKLPMWSAFLGKRGKEYVRFKLLNNDLPLTVPVSAVPKAELAAIPDPRPEEQKHPVKSFVRRQGPGIGMTIFNIITSWR